MSPIGPRHALAVDALTELLVSGVSGRAAVRVQNPITLDSGRSRNRTWLSSGVLGPVIRAPILGRGDILLLIEVADTSLEPGLGAKRAIYARAGIGSSGSSI